MLYTSPCRGGRDTCITDSDILIPHLHIRNTVWARSCAHRRIVWRPNTTFLLIAGANALSGAQVAILHRIPCEGPGTGPEVMVASMIAIMTITIISLLLLLLLRPSPLQLPLRKIDLAIEARIWCRATMGGHLRNLWSVITRWTLRTKSTKHFSITTTTIYCHRRRGLVEGSCRHCECRTAPSPEGPGRGKGCFLCFLYGVVDVDVVQDRSHESRRFSTQGHLSLQKASSPMAKRPTDDSNDFYSVLWSILNPQKISMVLRQKVLVAPA